MRIIDISSAPYQRWGKHYNLEGGYMLMHLDFGVWEIVHKINKMAVAAFFRSCKELISIWSWYSPASARVTHHFRNFGYLIIFLCPVCCVSQVLPPTSSTFCDTSDINIHVSPYCLNLPKHGCFNSSWKSLHSGIFTFWWFHNPKT